MIVEKAPAKINLALHVRRRMADGYHALETLFAFAGDGDEIRLEESVRDSFAIEGPFAPDLVPSSQPAGDDPATNRTQPANLVERARNRFRDTFALPPVAIVLTKVLPVASGIGGGSADAAATLRACARSTGVAADDPRVVAIARELGADVPACLYGRTSMGTGRGDDLVPVEGLAGAPLLLVNPRVGVSTAAVFARWDGVDRGGIGEGGLMTRALAGRNDLERPARDIAPVIGEVLASLVAQSGVTLSRMSGSGATCFALFETEAARDRAAAAACARGWWVMATTMA